MVNSSYLESLDHLQESEKCSTLRPYIAILLTLFKSWRDFVHEILRMLMFVGPLRCRM